MKKQTSIVLILFSLLLFCNNLFAQHKDSLFYDPGAYMTFQYSKSDIPLVTTQFWFYSKKHIYTELRYNYEDRKTASLYMGRVFKVGKHDELQIIPMLGGAVGRFNSISPASTMILEAGWIRGFSQSQYSINLKEPNSSFFFNWTALVIHTYKPLYLGASFQSIVPQNSKSQILFAPMVSVKDNHLIVEGFVYNFWTETPYWALGLQYFF